jgi:hypothetical protein
MQSCGGVILALVGGEWTASRPGRFSSGESVPDIHSIGGLVVTGVIFHVGKATGA